MMACNCRVSSRSQKTDSQKAEITRWLQQQGLVPTAVQWLEDIEPGHTPATACVCAVAARD